MADIPWELAAAIGSALTTVIVVLWRVVEREREEKTRLYKELIHDSEALEGILAELRKNSENEGKRDGMLSDIASRIAELKELFPIS